MADLETIGPACTGNWSFRQGTIKVAEPTIEEHAATKLYVDANSVQGFWEVNVSDDMQLKTARQLDMQSQKIISVLDPTSAQDAATKAYVDANIGGAVDSVFGRTGVVVAATDDYTWAQIDKTVSDIADITTKSHTSLSDIGVNTHATIDAHLAAANPHTNSTNKTGDTFTGSMSFDDGVGESPRANFINGSDNTGTIYMQTSGDLIIDTDVGNIDLNAAGDIDAKTNKIVNVVDPTSAQDAATKAYVDANSGASPLTTKGDIYTYSTADARLPVGTDGQVLSADSAEATGLKWITSGATTVSISHASFNPPADTTAFTLAENQLQNDSGATATFYATVQIPNGTSMSSAIVHGTTGGTWVLYSIASDGTATSLANGNMNSADNTISHTVDNTTYSYLFAASLANGSDVYGAEVTVT